MSSGAVLTGVFGALGTLLGGGVTAATGHLTASRERTAAREDRLEAARLVALERRRGTYIAFLSACSEFMEAARDLHAELDAGARANALALYDDSHRETWARMGPPLAAVRIEGPADLAATAVRYHDRLADYSNLLDDALLPGNYTASRARKLSAAREAAANVGRSFIEQARTASQLPEESPAA